MAFRAEELAFDHWFKVRILGSLGLLDIMMDQIKSESRLISRLIRDCRFEHIVENNLSWYKSKDK